MGGGMEAHRQMDDMFEEGGGDRDAAPVRKAVGMQRDGHAGGDAEYAERRPGGEPWPDAGPLQRSARPHGMRQLVDDLSEQKRLAELGHRERDIGETEPGGEPFFGRKQPKHPTVDFCERHREPSRCAIQ